MEKLKEKFTQPTEIKEEEPPQVQAQQAKNVRGKPAPPGKGAPPKEVVEEKKEEVINEYHENSPILFGKRNAELSELPKYYPLVHLVEETIMINPDKYFDYEKLDEYYNPGDVAKLAEDGKTRIHKTFDRSKKIPITTKII